MNQCICTPEVKKQWMDKVSRDIEHGINWALNLEKELCRKKNEKVSLQKELETLDYQDNSYEIEEKLWKAATTLEKKGYLLTTYAWSHLETDFKDRIEFTFQNSYWFDFTDFPSKKGWEYNQHWKCLCFRLSSISERVLKKYAFTPEEYLDWQRELLVEWVEHLPEARLLEKGEKVQGILGSGAFRQRKMSEKTE